MKISLLYGLLALTEFCGGELKGGNVGSESITFIPNNSWKSDLEVSIPTAGSIGLVLQVLQIGMLASNNHKVEISFRGGATFGKWAPSLNYLQKVTFPLFNHSGLDIKVEIQRHGMYPKGGAKVNCKIYPSTQELKPLNITELGNIDLIQGEIIITNEYFM